MNLNSIDANLVFISDLTETKFRGVDIGKELSQAIKDRIQDPRVALLAQEKLHELIEKNAFQDDKMGAIYALRNIGILFEPTLKIDFQALCKKYSRDSYLIIENKGDIDNDYLYFLTREAGKKIDLTDLNYTVL